MKTPYMIVDLLSILPFIAFLIFGSNMQVLWALQIFRIAKLFKLKRVKSAMIVIINVIKKQREPLLITLFVAFTLILSSGFIMYFVENPAQPEVFSSISKSMWWAVITLTTIGYGDMYPITPTGQFLGGIIALCGIAIIALPSGIIASGFSQEIERYKKLKKKENENQLTNK
jgi:voltage-gated potassium channel